MDQCKTLSSLSFRKRDPCLRFYRRAFAFPARAMSATVACALFPVWSGDTAVSTHLAS